MRTPGAEWEGNLRDLARKRFRAATAVLAAAWATASCAGAPARQTFRFPSDLSAADAYACVTAGLRRFGFETAPSAPDGRTVVALRRTPPNVDQAAEWWRITSTVSAGSDSTTTVESVAGAAPTRDGPLRAPPAELAAVLGKLAARCQWPASSPGR